MSIRVSDALPLQFYVNGETTFNESETDGIDKNYCFNQIFRCDDNIKLQIIEASLTNDYSLEVYDENDVLLDTLPFTRSPRYATDTEFSFSNPDFEVSITDWDQQGNGSTRFFTWNTGGGAIAAPGGGTLSESSKIYQSRLALGVDGFDKFPPGTYVISIQVKNSSAGGSSPLSEGLSLEAFDSPTVFGEAPLLSQTVPRDGAFHTYTFEITTTQEWSNFGFSLFKQGPSSGSQINVIVKDVQFLSYPFDFTESVYDLSFSADSLGFCDQKLKFKIVGDDGVEAETDLIEFKSEVSNTIKLNYKTSRNFAGLIGDDDFYTLRIEGRFFHEKNPTEQKALALSNSRIINTSSTLKKQKKLEVQDCPYFMHTKIQLALECAVSGTLEINSVDWTIEDAYEVDESRPDTYPFRPATAWLTRKNYVKRNVI